MGGSGVELPAQVSEPGPRLSAAPPDFVRAYANLLRYRSARVDGLAVAYGPLHPGAAHSVLRRHFESDRAIVRRQLQSMALTRVRMGLHELQQLVDAERRRYLGSESELIELERAARRLAARSAHPSKALTYRNRWAPGFPVGREEVRSHPVLLLLPLFGLPGAVRSASGRQVAVTVLGHLDLVAAGIARDVLVAEIVPWARYRPALDLAGTDPSWGRPMSANFVDWLTDLPKPGEAASLGLALVSLLTLTNPGLSAVRVAVGALTGIVEIYRVVTAATEDALGRSINATVRLTGGPAVASVGRLRQEVIGVSLAVVFKLAGRARPRKISSRPPPDPILPGGPRSTRRISPELARERQAELAKSQRLNAREMSDKMRSIGPNARGRGRGRR